MKRDDWVVPYTGNALLAAATGKLEFHEGRRKWWGEKKEELIGKIRAEGINVTESVVDELGKLGYHTSNAAIGGPTIQIDAGLAAQVREAAQKVHEHDGKIAQYKAWMQMLEAHQNANFDLDHDDWMFFFGK